jgi:uncharacterized protein YceK
MRRIICLVFAAGLMNAGCASVPEAADAAPSTVAEIAEAAVIEGAQDSETALTSPPEAPTPAAPSIPATSTQTTPPIVSPVETSTDDEPVGDGPVLTAPAQPAGGDTASETPSASSNLTPVFFGFNATTATGCADADPGTVTLQWEVIGTESVSIAFGNESEILSSGQPAAGSLDVPLDCAEGSTYFVVAENPGGRTVRSTSVAP